MHDPILATLTRARVHLLLEQPMFGHLILHLENREVQWCGTAATDGKYLFFNRVFIESLDFPELVFLVAHEVAHCLLDHLFRRGDRDPNLWNFAADALVNDLVSKQGIGKMPQQGILLPQYTSDDFTVEQLYELLKDKAITIRMPLDEHLDGNGDGSEDGPPQYTEMERQQIRDQMQTALVQGVQAQEASKPGSTPSGILRAVDRLLRPRIDWRQMLNTVLRSTIRHDYTYTRLSRRCWSTGLLLPGQDVLERVEAVACLDGSASTTVAMISDFLMECHGIMSTFRDFKLTVMTFDTEVYNVREFTPENADDIRCYEFYGGGGTDPGCCWRYLHEHRIQPHRLLVFTDGEVIDWGEPDYCDTLFIIHSNPLITAPYGQTTHYDKRPRTY